MKKLLCVALLSAASSAFAGDFYVGAGLPGVMVGYAQPVSEDLTLRADFATLGSISRTRTEDGINYKGDVTANRVGLFADWFVAGDFRLTGGVTFNNMRADLSGQGNGAQIKIGNSYYAAGADERFDVRVKFPRTTPYVGIGYGRGASDKAGWNFAFDLGLSVGKPKVTGTVSGPMLSTVVTQADIDQELADIREDTDRIKGIPQLSFAVGYRF